MADFGLDNQTITLIKNLFSGIDAIESVKIFGSRAKGNYKPSSDIDFAIFGNFDEKFMLHILSELEELPVPYKFDVLNYNTEENENIKQNIDTYGKIFYKKGDV